MSGKNPPNVRSRSTRSRTPQGSPPRQVAQAARIALLPLTLLASCEQSGFVPGEPAPPSLAAAPARLYRLTRTQYRETVRALLGGDIRVPTDLEADTPLHGYSTVGAGELTVAPRAAEQYEAAAYDLAAQALEPARRMKLVGCEVKAEPGDACGRDFLARFGRRAYRRTLRPDELSSLMALRTELGATLGDPWKALEFTVAAVLQSPNFLYRVEIGEPVPPPLPVEGEPEPAPSAPRLRYTGFELASRLSYLVWNGPPDDELLDAAERGELAEDAGLVAQLERLLRSERARAGIGRFFTEYLKLERLDTLSKDAAAFPKASPALFAAMRGEVERVALALALDGERDLRDLLTTTQTFVTPELGALYGLKDVPAPGPDGFAKAEHGAGGPRAGLLGMAGVLALNAHQSVTSPTLRGRFIREYLLCQDIPPPPPGVSTSLPPMMGQKTTLRQRLEAHRQDPACRGCHSLMDPLGLSLENFDALGAFRERDGELPIDASAELEGRAVQGAAELGAALRDNPRLVLCMARQLYRYATGHLELAEEQELVLGLGARLGQSGGRFPALLRHLVLSDGFRYAAPPADASADAAPATPATPATPNP